MAVDLTTYDDEQLLQLINDGSCAAFAAIYNRYKVNMLLHATKKLDSSDEAEDIVHDLFASAWRNRSAIDSNIKAYLYTALRNRIIDYQIKSANTRKLIESVKAFSANKPVLNTDFKVREAFFIKQIDNLINELSPVDQSILKMRMNGYSNQEIAESLDIAEKTVRNHSWMILKNLRSRLSSKFFLVL